MRYLNNIMISNKTHVIIARCFGSRSAGWTDGNITVQHAIIARCFGSRSTIYMLTNQHPTAS
jgi:hypothetical protein